MTLYSLGNVPVSSWFSGDMTRRDAMLELVAALRSSSIDDPGFDARLLFCAALGIDYVDFIREPYVKLGEDAAMRLAAWLLRRKAREPVSRILGKRGFWSLDLIVSPDVLDPRPDTETLVDTAIEMFADSQHKALRIADLGTGSGALLCALLDVFPNASGVATDISEKACLIARRNLDACGYAGRYSVVCGGWKSANSGLYDLVVSNPPYIRTNDIDGLAPEVRDHDPRIALDGGADGLHCYREIVSVLPDLLAPMGIAILEIGVGQEQSVRALLCQERLLVAGAWIDIGGHPRAIAVVKAKKAD